MHVNFPIFSEKSIIHSYSLMYYKADHVSALLSRTTPTQTVMCRHFAFKRTPNSNCNLKVICFQREPNKQPLKCVSTLLLNFIEGIPKRNCNM